MNMSVSDLSVGCRFADYFAICGLDFDSGLEPDRLCGDNLHVSPLDRSYKGKVLAHYPDNVQSNTFDEHAVCMLCLPTGLQFRTQKHSLEANFHSFVVTRENASRYYGFSLIFYEEVRNRNICSAMHTLQAMYITELSSGQTPPGHRKSTGKESSRSLPRSFKLAPHSGAALTYYDVTKDKLYVAKSIALICQYPYVRVAQLFLENLYRSLPRQPGPGLSPESFVYNLLYEVPVPLPGQALRLYVPPAEPHLEPVPVVIRMPNAPEELPLLDYPLRVMFSTLGVECVVQLFTCVLLEHQVLLRSSDYSKLMLVAECMVSLLLPFTWAHVYVPILPAPLYHFLDAPVPFVMGLHADSAAISNGSRNIALGSEAALCLVDIDKPDIQLPEELPIYPHRTPFIEELNYILDKHQIQRPETEPTKLGVPINGTSYKQMNDMSSSCTLPSGGLRRKHSFNDVLEWDESRPLNASPPGSPTRRAPRRLDALQRIVDIVKRTGVNIDDVDADSVMPVLKKKPMNDEEQYNEDARLNCAIRETFLNRFVHMFLTYENFIIMPDQDRETWLSARESMANFDKASFLSDQPQRHRPFLSRFLETQMFATFIDNKIMANWGEYDANLQAFEHRIKTTRRRLGDAGMGRSYSVWAGGASASSGAGLEVSAPSERLPHRAAYYRAFPARLDVAALTPPPSNDRRTNSLKRIKNAKWQVKDSAPEMLLGDIGSRLSTEVTAAAISQNHRTFVEKLLKECKSKTKRMLVEKMGTEETDLGLGCEVSITGVEESTMIASLCDLLERLWSHGVQHKMGKSALWMHLMNYQELEQCSNSTKPIDPNYLTPDLSSVGAEVEAQQSSSSGARSRDSSRGGSRDSSRDRLSNSGTLERRSSQTLNPLRPLPESLTFDMRNIQAMTDIKTEIGYARAWVRLSLEKKLLSKHLRELLADTTLLRSQYKKTAFLRCEEEREQFLYHLLTLNAVDYFCFTNTYPTTKLPYRVLIAPSRKASQTTANCWIAISGANGDSTPKIPIPRNTNEFVFHHKNLGILSTLRIGHDNSGLSPRWLLDQVYVRNEVTGHTYTFPCNRWLGTGVDDGSTERLLVAARLRGRTPRTPAPAPAPTPTHLSTSTIQHMIAYWNTEAARILAAIPTPSISHQMPFRPLTQELARKGHEVVVITTDPAFPKGQATANLTEIDIHDMSYEIWRKVLANHTNGDCRLIRNLALALSEKCLIIFEKLTAVSEVKDIIDNKNNSFDLLILEAWPRFALGLSQAVNVPVISMSSFGALVENYDTVGGPTHPLLYPHCLVSRVYHLSPWEKIYGLYNLFSRLHHYNKLAVKENAVVRRIFGDDTPALRELQNKLNLLFLNIHPVWEGNYPVPTGVVYVAGIDQKPEKDLPQDLKEYLDYSAHGVIYLSFGTNVQTSALPAAKIQAIINVFSQLPYDVLWKWNQDELPGRTNNIKIAKWFPQSDVLSDCVNAIVKWHYQSKRDKDANSLSVLLCGENGLVKCLEQAFLCGFKSSRLFGKNFFIWDYFAKVKDEFKMSLCDEPSTQAQASKCGVAYNCRQDQEHRAIWRCYCHLMDEVNSVGRALGKDGKFQLFICLSLREHWLHRMLVPMSLTRVTSEMYEDQSFMRKRGLLTFLRQILEPLDEFDIVLENSLTQGI